MNDTVSGSHTKGATPGFDNISSFGQITKIRKRDGEVIPFDMNRIVDAVSQAMGAAGEGDGDFDAAYIARKVVSSFQRTSKLLANGQEVVPTVEAIQDAVIRELFVEGYTATATHYVLYREEHAKRRAAKQLSPKVMELVKQSKQYFHNPLAEFTYYRTYSRWIESENRRETWVETVQRYMDYMISKLGAKLTPAEYDKIGNAILRMEVMPSMRLLWSAGPAVERTNVCAFNCAYTAPTSWQDFAEILYILACGTGVGFSVEARNVEQLPIIERQSGVVQDMLVLDSKEGWADALATGMLVWSQGSDVKFDLTQLRPEGARLKTMGGRSSGPKPLADLLNFVRAVMLRRQGRRLTSRDVHDIICKIGDCIVAGGVRRSALISLSDLDDVEMRDAKTGYWFIENGHRTLANNSAVYEGAPSDEVFLSEWLALIRSRSGERGIFNRGSLINQVPKRRLDKWAEMGVLRKYPDVDADFDLLAQVGTNPCGEINLLPKQFCNLTEVVCRKDDTEETLVEKVRIATILGTFQSMLTDFPYLSPDWKKNCDQERLLGVSLTGQWDCPVVRESAEVRMLLRGTSVSTNAEYAKRFGIHESTATTCGKPSGTVSLLVDSSSGCHARRSQYYLRRVRISSSDPLLHMLRDQGVPVSPENGQNAEDANTWVVTFPVKSPTQGPFAADLTALDQLHHWKKIKTEFTEHNPSVTINVRPNEWIIVANWIRAHWPDIGGLSFLPFDDHVYEQAPEEECSEEEYKSLVKVFEGLDYSLITVYEKEDTTVGAKEYACVSGVCTI